MRTFRIEAQSISGSSEIDFPESQRDIVEVYECEDWVRNRFASLSPLLFDSYYASSEKDGVRCEQVQLQTGRPRPQGHWLLLQDRSLSSSSLFRHLRYKQKTEHTQAIRTDPQGIMSLHIQMPIFVRSGKKLLSKAGTYGFIQFVVALPFPLIIYLDCFLANSRWE